MPTVWSNLFPVKSLSCEPDSARQARSFKHAGHTDPLAVGDVVRFIDSRDGTGQIVEMLPRRNRLARRSVVPMPGAHATCQAGSTIDQELPEAIEQYRQAGYPVILTSALIGEGIDEL